jgi:hypothetical protein
MMKRVSKPEVEKIEPRQSKVPNDDLKHVRFRKYYIVQIMDD